MEARGKHAETLAAAVPGNQIKTILTCSPDEDQRGGEHGLASSLWPDKDVSQEATCCKMTTTEVGRESQGNLTTPAQRPPALPICHSFDSKEDVLDSANCLKLWREELQASCVAEAPAEARPSVSRRPKKAFNLSSLAPKEMII